MRQDLRLKPYKLPIAQQLKEDDPHNRLHACQAILHMIDDKPEARENILMTDESLFTLSNVIHPSQSRVWSPTKPEQPQERPMQPPRILVWCGISAQSIIGPYYFDNAVNTDTYLEMLQTFLIPTLRRLRLVRRTIFQQDGAGAHTAGRVLDYLHEVFGDRVISRKCELAWPARSPDLTAPDFFLWGTLKHKVKVRKPTTIENLKAVLEEEIQILNQDKSLLNRVLNNAIFRMRECVRKDGGHIRCLKGCH